MKTNFLIILSILASAYFLSYLFGKQEMRTAKIERKLFGDTVYTVNVR